MAPLRDPITGIPISDQLQEQQRQAWQQQSRQSVDDLVVAGIQTAADLCHRLVAMLDTISCGEKGQPPVVPLCNHAPDTFLPDHALMTSAIAYCLAVELAIDPAPIRLAALGHELPPAARERLAALLDTETAEFLRGAWDLLDGQGAALAEAGDDSLAAFAGRTPATGDPRLDLLWYAHLAASQPLSNGTLALPDQPQPLPILHRRADFDDHPLRQIALPHQTLGLVLGGASRVKNYVFESAKLPEIRGGSVLLDRLNRRDCLDLFADAPECVVYANGGDLLALAPASQAQRLAKTLETLYSEQTLTGDAVFVAGAYSLLALQYGIDPQAFWCDDYLSLLEAGDEEQRALLRGYYGAPDDEWSDEMRFHRRKGFGEVVTQLSLKRYWRREGNEGAWGDHPDQASPLPTRYETFPFGTFCSSCDRRIARLRVPDLDDPLCEPCARKRWAGWVTRRRDRERADIFEQHLVWRPNWPHALDPWHKLFERYLDDDEALEARYLHGWPDVGWQDLDSPDTLDQIGQAARSPQGYIGLVYADGNNVGALIERIRTPGFYRQFASRLFLATQAAVFEALARHLHPARVRSDKNEPVTIHPFEIVGIGGDDLFLIVPAESALPIAHAIAAFMENIFHNGEAGYQKSVRAVERYQYELPAPPGRPQVSLSAGVVLAPAHAPIFFLTDLVEELLVSAKQKAKRLKRQGHYGGTVDFMALKATNMVISGIEDFRHTGLRVVQGKDTDGERNVLNLTARPYTLHELGGLLRLVTLLKEADFPRTQLYQLRTLLNQGRFVSSLSYLYFTSRLRDHYPAMLRRLLDQAWYTPAQDPIPWRYRNRELQNGCTLIHWETIFADLIELYDFVPKPEAANPEPATAAEDAHAPVAD